VGNATAVFFSALSNWPHLCQGWAINLARGPL